MIHNLNSALIITGIGMGMVFIVILLLWGLMELMDKIKDPAEEEEVADEIEAAAVEIPAEDGNSKRKAAAAAVAVALGLSYGVQRVEGVRLNVSSWQAVHRAGHFSRRASVNNRKSRGR